jgi:hypothetical protein
MTYCSPYEFNALKYPQNLTGAVTFETGAADLIWNFNEAEAEGFLNFNIYRDGELIGTETDTVYTDMLPDYGYYSYQVTAFYQEDKESSASGVDLQWGDAHISVTPTIIYEHLTVDSTSTKYIKVFNTGQLDLMYNISAFVEEQRSADAYCTAKGGGDEHISHVVFGDIDNATGYGGVGYSDFTSMSTNISFGVTYQLTVENGHSYDSDQCGAWIDWNQNEIFDDGMIEFVGSPGDGPYTAEITPPLGAVKGNTTMRIRIRYTGDLNPCDDTPYGEVEDYTVNVLGWLDLNPVLDTVHPGDSSIIAVNFDATDLEPGIYNAIASFFANDPDAEQVDVPLTLQVSNTFVQATAVDGLSNVCYGTSTQLNATPFGATGTPTYSWSSDPAGFSSNEKSPVIQPVVSSWYYVEMTANNGTATDSILITVKPLPEVDLGADTIICGNGQIVLDAGNQGETYLWSTGETTQTITVDSLTMFAGYGDREIMVTAVASNGCSNDDTIIVNVKNCTGIEEFSDNVSVRIFPNPSDGEFNVELNARLDERVDVIVVNQVGAVVYSNENISLKGQKILLLNLENNAPGVYQLFIKGQKGFVNKKLIVK